MILSDGDVDDDIQYWSRDLIFCLFQNKHENMGKFTMFTLDTKLLTLQMSILHLFCLYKHLNIPF